MNAEVSKGYPMAAVRVLIVDDEPLITAAVAGTLARHGYHAVAASGARQAFEIIRSGSSIDVVLSDVTMPEMCGTDLVREIARSFPGTACLLMTGTMGAMNLPPEVPLLRKPISTRDLIDAIERVTSKNREHRANLREALDRSVQLRLQAQQLRGESREATQQSKEELERVKRHADAKA